MITKYILTLESKSGATLFLRARRTKTVTRLICLTGELPTFRSSNWTMTDIEIL
jgi:hypothetical protein